MDIHGAVAGWVQTKPADCGVCVRGHVETHWPVSYETACPEVLVGDHRAVMSALCEQDVPRRDFLGLT